MGCKHLPVQGRGMNHPWGAGAAPALPSYPMVQSLPALHVQYCAVGKGDSGRGFNLSLITFFKDVLAVNYLSAFLVKPVNGQLH